MNLPAEQYEEPLLLKLNPSKRLEQLAVFIHVLALFACLANSLTMVTQYALLAGIFVHLRFVMKRLKSGLYTIKHSEASGWEMALSNHFESVQILPSTTITRFAVFLHFSGQKSKSPLRRNKLTALVAYDALGEDDYRRFAVRLKTSFIKQQQAMISIEKI